MDEHEFVNEFVDFDFYVFQLDLFVDIYFNVVLINVVLDFIVEYNNCSVMELVVQLREPCRYFSVGFSF